MVKITPSAYISQICTYYPGGDNMASYVAPELREKFETLSIDLKNNILERDVQLHNIHDLINILEIISKGE